MDNRIDKSGVKVIVGVFIAPILQGVILFAAAGHTMLPRFWMFLMLFFALNTTGIFNLYRQDPVLLNHRGRWRQKTDTKAWDKILLPLWAIIALYLLPAAAGLDAGRYHWGDIGILYFFPGIVLYSTATVIVFWAMLTNTHFEMAARIQTDRNHKVITHGPYKYIRHPGYLGMALLGISAPLILGSLAALGVGVVAGILLCLRTYWEDQTLLAELEGYAEYAKQTPYRLIPRVW